MKPEEAIKIIEVAKAECEWNAPLEFQEAFDAAIDALEKQIPKPSVQPIMQGWVCPVCGGGLSPFTSICPCKRGKGWEITCQQTI